MRVLFLVLGFFSYSSFIFGQNGGQAVDLPTSFAGKWVLNKNKSDAGIGMTVTFPDSTMVATQSADEIVITYTTIMDGKKSVRKTIYLIGTTADETVKSNSEDKVAAKWEGKKLVIGFEGALGTVQGGVRSPVMESREEWSLSMDGKTLTQTINGKGMPGTAKFVYSKSKNQ